MPKMTMKGLINVLALLAILAFAQTSLLAQELVHAMVGTTAGSDPTTGSITLQLADRTSASFDSKPDLSTHIAFDDTLRNESTTVNELPKGTTHVIVYYYGLSPAIVVAVKDLGQKIESVIGTITSIDETDHSITIQSETGQLATCYVSSETTVETPYGALDGTKYSVQKGEKVSSVCTNEAGKEMAQFIQPLND
jgi:hypothetical protein